MVRPARVSVASFAALALLVSGLSIANPTMVLVSVSSEGDQGDCGSWSPAVSRGGRIVAFVSCATDLVPGDTNGVQDVFVRDLTTGETTRVSVSSTGKQANGVSGDLSGDQRVSISDDGRFVAFDSYASNLVPGDTNGWSDVFVRDRLMSVTTRISVSSSGEQANRYSEWSSISGDGRFVAFESSASNLVAHDTNDEPDVFVRNRTTGQTRRVSVRSDGSPSNWASGRPDLSVDGRFVAFLSVGPLVRGDTNGSWDVYVRDRRLGKTARVSVRSDGRQANSDSDWPVISGGGRIVAFVSWATNLAPTVNGGLPDVFVHDRATRTTTIVSVRSDGTPGHNQSGWPTISDDGLRVAFESNSSLVPGDRNHGDGDIYRHNVRTGRTSIVSIDLKGHPAGGSSFPALTPTGRAIAFESSAADLVANDTNEETDVFMRA